VEVVAELLVERRAGDGASRGDSREIRGETGAWQQAQGQPGPQGWCRRSDRAGRSIRMRDRIGAGERVQQPHDRSGEQLAA
jgi:hypothetical protein